MSPRLIAMCLLATAAATLLTGCLVRRTVTNGGEVTSSNYMVKRPLKNLAANSSE